MAAYAALASLLNDIEHITTHPLISTSLEKYQIEIESLLKTADSLLHLIHAYHHGGGVISKEAEDLERQIASAVHAAEDLIESHIVDHIRAGSNQLSFTCSLNLQQVIQEMDSILKRAAEVKEKHPIREKQPTNSRPLMERGDSAMLGFDDEESQLFGDVINQQSAGRVISIVGMGGAGKTTLAQNLYQNSHINKHFDFLAWATASQQHTAQEILSQLLSGRGGNSSSGNVGDSGEELHKTLWGRRYLLVLDDIWSIQAWDEVRRFFPNDESGSRIVITTRLFNVARDCCSSSCVTMKPLDERKTWKLFCRKAFQQENCPYPELEEVGKKIARLCRGLPLSTVVVGGFLSKSPRSLQFWENVARNMESNPNAKEKEESLDALSLSYNHLPPHLKPCFLYMGVFREYSEIRVSKIIRLWIAEGFVRPNNSQTLEVVAEGYLEELIDRNLISVRKHRHNGKVGSCGIHDMLRDLCSKVAKQEEFFHEIDGLIQGTERRLMCYSRRPILLHGEHSVVRSMLAGGSLEQPVKHKLLRVWDRGSLESVAELYGNVNLRYLACHYTYYSMPVLPSSISLIWNLQTLIISDTLVTAPTEIWKMQQLRHVKCHRIYLPPPSDGLLVMDDLQSLTTAVNLRLSEQDKELNKMVRFPILLNKLSLITSKIGWEDLSMIGSLPQLQVLHLRVKFITWGRKWSPIEGQFPCLKFLKIHCRDLQYWDADKSHFPVLEKLILSQLWCLEEIPLGIGEIPTLKLIHLNHCSKSAAVSAVRIKEDEVENHGNDALRVELRMPQSDVESFKEMVEAGALTITHVQLETF
ncbi:putative late blight resistance protein homolog R1B-16 [Salvia hispanica]|uniref:putative late blight resistance protein homolog R1B-16 n=1 Tax=Salvia hispanica TaxID=49212 RepID=UPI00200942B4|nr:putative late blight resistance protein homolog R1B-16 [Salvia hispanica]